MELLVMEIDMGSSVCCNPEGLFIINGWQRCTELTLLVISETPWERHLKPDNQIPSLSRCLADGHALTTNGTLLQVTLRDSVHECGLKRHPTGREQKRLALTLMPFYYASPSFMHSQRTAANWEQGTAPVFRLTWPGDITSRSCNGSVLLKCWIETVPPASAVTKGICAGKKVHKQVEEACFQMDWALSKASALSRSKH
eukprot:1160031-Pelagomonas_calceolata.AAC.7